MNNINPYYYPFEEIGHPNKLQTFTLPEPLKVYLLSSTEDKRDIFIYQERQSLRSNKKEDKNVSKLFLSLAMRLSNCEYITQVFDIYGDKLHMAFTHTIDSNKVNIYRLRRGCVRLYFVIIKSSMVMFRLSLKKEDKISKSEKKIIADRVEAIYKVPPDENSHLKRVML